MGQGGHVLEPFFVTNLSLTWVSAVLPLSAGDKYYDNCIKEWQSLKEVHDPPPSPTGAQHLPTSPPPLPLELDDQPVAVISCSGPQFFRSHVTLKCLSESPIVRQRMDIYLLSPLPIHCLLDRPVSSPGSVIIRV